MRRPCERCGLEFSGRRASAKFCSASCRQAAWREGNASAAVGDATPLEAVSEDDVPELVADAVAAGPQRGLTTLALWLAETLDGLNGPARAVHGPRVAGQLTAVLKALRPPSASSGGAPVSRLQALRDARAAQDARRG